MRRTSGEVRTRRQNGDATEPRGKEVKALGAAIKKAHLDLSEVVLGELRGETLEAHLQAVANDSTPVYAGKANGTGARTVEADDLPDDDRQR